MKEEKQTQLCLNQIFQTLTLDIVALQKNLHFLPSCEEKHILNFLIHNSFAEIPQVFFIFLSKLKYWL